MREIEQAQRNGVSAFCKRNDFGRLSSKVLQLPAKDVVPKGMRIVFSIFRQVSLESHSGRLDFTCNEASFILHVGSTPTSSS